MNPDTIQLLAIVGAIIVAIFIVQYFKHRTAVALSNTKAEELSAVELERLHSEVAALKQRVEVLETIVTDSRYDLKSKIAAL